MDLPDDPETYIKINFDNGNYVRMDKSYLMDHSLYFNAMFGGQFIEGQSGNEITLKNISDKGFMYVIESLRSNHIDMDRLDELFILLETSLILQFTKIINKCMMIIESNLFTISTTIQIFSFSSKLGLERISDKARVYVLYNFKRFLMQNKSAFFELSKEDLQLLLKDNGLNVNDETDVYNLILDWCTETHNIDNGVLYDMVIGCVNFNSMSKFQLESCISKTKNCVLQNAMKQLYDRDTFDVTDDLKTLLIRPRRMIPSDLCTIKNEDDGYACIYRWNWITMNFEQFITVDPLPRDSIGYHVTNKDLDIYVFGGEIGLGRGQWNDSGWRYNLLTKQWKPLENFIISKRRHGIGHFCGDSLYLIGGRTKHRLENKLVEQFALDIEDKLIRVNSCQNLLYSNLIPKVDRKDYISLEYNGQLIMINKEVEPSWYTLSFDSNCLTDMYIWRSFKMNINAKVVCATTYRNSVYLLGYNENKKIILFMYYPTRRSCEEIKSFKTVYNMEESTVCTFNHNKVMVFGNKTLECYSIDDDVCDEYVIDINLTFKYFFSVPAY